METAASLTLSVFDIARLVDFPWIVSGPFGDDDRAEAPSDEASDRYEGKRLDALSTRMMLLVLQRRGRMSLSSIQGETIGLRFYSGSKRWDVVAEARPSLRAEFAKRRAAPEYWSWERAFADRPADPPPLP